MFEQEITPSRRVMVIASAIIGVGLLWNLVWFRIVFQFLPAWWPLLIPAAPFATYLLATLLIRPLRIAIDQQHLVVRMGLWSQRIALADIASFESAQFGWAQRRHWGVRWYFPMRTVYFMAMGTNGKSVRVVKRDGRVLQFSSNDPDAVCAALAMRKGIVTASTAWQCVERRTSAGQRPPPNHGIKRTTASTSYTAALMTSTVTIT